MTVGGDFMLSCFTFPLLVCCCWWRIAAALQSMRKPDIVLTQTRSPASGLIYMSDTITYTIGVDNSGNWSAKNVTTKLVLPAGLKFEASPAGRFTYIYYHKNWAQRPFHGRVFFTNAVKHASTCLTAALRSSPKLA